MVFDMLKNKILFIIKRCKHNNYKVLTSKNLSFLVIILFVIIIRFFKLSVKDEINENNFNIHYSKSISSKKKLTSIFKTFKEKIIQKLNFIDIIEINVLTYYYLIKNKENKLFFLITNKIYNILIKSFEVLLRME